MHSNNVDASKHVFLWPWMVEHVDRVHSRLQQTVSNEHQPQGCLNTGRHTRQHSLIAYSLGARDESPNTIHIQRNTTSGIRFWEQSRRHTSQRSLIAYAEEEEEEEEEGLHGVHRQLCRNEHPKTKEGC
jgi:hypothetical protein